QRAIQSWAAAGSSSVSSDMPSSSSLAILCLAVMTLEGQRVTGQVNFNSHTDAVVRMAVALVNLLTPGEDRSRAYAPPAGAELAARLNALFKSAGSRTVVTSAEAEAFAPVAADLRAVFAAVAAGRHDGEPWHLHFHSADEGSPVNSWAAGCATGLAIVLGGELYDRLGVCTAPH